MSVCELIKHQLRTNGIVLFQFKAIYPIYRLAVTERGVPWNPENLAGSATELGVIIIVNYCRLYCS